ncbi:MAG: hypothetical protein JWQ81_6831 [Amycolatopsis sp.]|uniref:hypothetical protein n=1 Tax=Amycolatopsis sp. TaxID=37632 RepID=UPI0026196779|nr:hypothetical protein [Amycolatopsis sp.]MCU1686092.1 hypothetical protein [Amycolatopsis sp.]
MAEDADYTVRWWVENGQIHQYLKADLADPAIEWLVPRCSDVMYPVRHPRVELTLEIPRTCERSMWCRGCQVAGRRSRGVGRDSAWREPGGLVADVHRANAIIDRAADDHWPPAGCGACS